MSRSYSNYTGAIVKIDAAQKANYNKVMKTCSNEQCSCHKNESKYNFCPECGSPIKEMTVTLKIQAINYLRSHLKDLMNEYMSVIAIGRYEEGEENPHIILVEGCYHSAKIGEVVSAEKTIALATSARNNENYKKLMKVLEESTLFYSDKACSVMIVE